jgi:hypothetical protein
MDYINLHVKLLLNNNIMIEGIVQEWSNSSVKLLSIDNNSVSIITHPDEDIRVIKIINNLPKPNKNNIPELEKEIEATYDQPSDDLRLKTLVELKQELFKKEKEIVENKLKNHNISEFREIKYELPGFFKK